MPRSRRGTSETSMRAPALRARLVELDRGKRGAVDTIPAGVRTDQHEAVARALYPGPHQPVDPHQADAHRVDDWVVRVALVEVDFAPHGRDADAVPIAADSGDDAIEVMARAWQRTEAQRIEEGDRPSRSE